MVDWTKPVQVLGEDKEWHNVVSITVGKLSAAYAALVWYDERNAICAGVFSNESTLVRNTPPAPTWRAYTFDTFPRGVVYVRSKCAVYLSRHDCDLVTSISNKGVTVGVSACGLIWQELLVNFEMSIDLGKTWQPCGERVEA